MGLQAQHHCHVSPTPELLTYAQPDGTELQLYLRGNAVASYLETPDGYVVLPDANDRYVYAQATSDGDLIPGEVLAHNVGQRPFDEFVFLQNQPTELRYSGRVLADREEKFAAQLPAQSAAERNRSYFPTTGAQNALMLLVDYSDQAHIHSVAEIDAMCNGENYAANNATGSFRTYFQDISNNQLTVDVTVEDWIHAPLTRAHYDANVRELVRLAVDSAEVAGVDFSQYDNDGDGRLDQLLIIHSGRGQEDGSDADNIWSHKGTLGDLTVTYDGVEIKEYIIQPERTYSEIARIGILCHEFGHALGLPDLYDYDGSSSGLAVWCLMSNGTWNNGGRTPSHPNAWCKEELGWIDPVVLTDDGAVADLASVEAAGGSYRLNTDDPTEYFILENRQQTGWDAHLPGHGLAVWHIDTDAGGNQNEWQPRVSLRQADGLQELQEGSWSDADDLFPHNLNNVFNADSAPSSANHDGSASGISLSNIAEQNSLISFNYSNTNINYVITRPLQSADDAEEMNSSGYIDLASSDLELIHDAYQNRQQQTIGIRFPSLNLPANALIDSAFVQFSSKGADNTAVEVTFHAQASDDAAAFTDTNYDITTRPRTQNSVDWNIPAWTAYETGAAQRTPDLTSLISEVSSRANWSAGNALTLFVSGDGVNRRTPYSYDGNNAQAPYLVVYYRENPCAPDVDADGDGVCANLDCDDTDATIFPGAACDDGDPNTENDAYNDDCECQGDPVICLATTLYEDGFENNYGNWNNGGNNCRRNLNDAAFAAAGDYCVRLRNGTATSQLTSDVLDLSTASDLSIQFEFQFRGLEWNEQLFLERSDDGGTSYTTLETWTRNGSLKNKVLTGADVNVPAPYSATTTFRFRLAGNESNDRVYLDQIVIGDCGSSAAPAAPVTTTTTEPTLRVYPNPVSDILTVETTASARLQLLDSRGQVLREANATDPTVHKFDLSDLPTGLYLLYDGERAVRVVKQ